MTTLSHCFPLVFVFQLFKISLLVRDYSSLTINSGPRVTSSTRSNRVSSFIHIYVDVHIRIYIKVLCYVRIYIVTSYEESCLQITFE